MNILIIKPSSLGDIIQAGPTAVVLRKLFPASRISWLVFDRWAAIPALFASVDEVIVWRRGGGAGEYLRVIRAVRQKQFDIVIDLQGLLRSAVIARLSGAKTVIGVPGLKEGSWFLMKEAAPAWRSFNAVWRSLETIRHLDVPGGIPPDSDFPGVDMHDLRTLFDLTVPVSARDEAAEILRQKGVISTDTVIGVVPAARGKGKQWPSASYVQLIAMLQRYRPDIKIVLFDSAPSALISRTAAGTIDLGGALTLHQLAAVCQRCAVVVGGDTGPVHLAAALGIPAVVLFGGSDVTETAPVSPLATILKKQFPCSPCRGSAGCLKKHNGKTINEDYPCLAAITPAEVFAAVEKWIQ